MSASYSLPNPSVPTLDLQQQKGPSRNLDTPRMIERLAIEMRARSGGELPHSFYVEKVKQRLRGENGDSFMPADVMAQQMPSEAQSVFHAWALRE
ncbi:hypothetical protein EPK99_08605 [Neorhizobium lilium]|uniref:Uncharacterized protein n=1 Tax=Neorhizobium lilium TaxID=2503024 RepID=A0A3S3SEX3_9HYPH|nr:hypothetical protein [Neorhizobium lilium]RWX78648.1 hypothetical protein EPK99_08605 [Neorhizobium lilium]